MARKTVNIKALIAELNRRLAHPDVGVFERQAIAGIAEYVLIDADQYAGFSYQPSEWITVPTQMADGSTQDQRELKPPSSRDEYRRVYYYAHN